MRALLTAVILGGLFGSATATVESMDAEMMVVDLEVEVLTPADSVVAHLSFDSDPVLTLPLLDRGDGAFGVTIELEPKNYVVVFEAIGADPESSDPVSLTQMGAELGPESGETTPTTEAGDLSDESRSMLWLAVALGAASLSALAFWVLGGRARDEKENVATEDE